MMIADCFCLAIRSLNWCLHAATDMTKLGCFHERPPDACWLEWILGQGERTADLLTVQGRQDILSLRRSGICLHDRLPRAGASAIERWMGHRFYLTSQRCVAPDRQFTSIISSQLGRDSRRLTNWPQLLSATLHSVARNGTCLLLVRGTTLYEATKHFAMAAQLPVVEVLLPESFDQELQESTAWLAHHLKRCLASYANNPLSQSILVSPTFSTNQDVPLRDRAAICLADRVLALTIRRGGTLSKLVQRRLAQPDFSVGSTFIVIQSASEQEDWLDRGAVGWVVPSHEHPKLALKTHCKKSHGSQSSTLQSLCFPAKALVLFAPDTWPYLTHCTRALTGPMPQESTANYYLRLWLAGCNELAQPLGTLSNILSEYRLRGSSQLTRGPWPIVSFSAVPLLELLSRRKFRSHLGRWDWEPYGLIIHRQALPTARPVIYSQRREFEQLSAEDKPYFQPLDTKHDWTNEKEWRVQGDVELRQLPCSSVIAFVPKRFQALQLSRLWPYAVTWIEE